MNKTEKAVALIKEQTDKGLSYDDISVITGFNAHKLYRWVKNSSFPSIRVASKILKSNFP